MNNIIQQNLKEPIKDRWLTDLSEVITNLDDLYDYVNLPKTSITSNAILAKKQFPLRVPKAFASRIEKANPNDPLLLQIVCQADEMQLSEGFSTDPLDEQDNELPNLLHKYHNRVLLIFKTACAINCRYCFRRHFPYSHNGNTKQELMRALTYINNHSELDEVILSGGDPLMAKDKELEFFLTELTNIPHIKRLRIHSRLPIVIPSRITPKLADLFLNSHLKIILVTHINHPNEIDCDVCNAMKRLEQSNVTLFNQSVLLKGINDDVQTLKQLSEKLFDDAGITPYYLHLLDKVQGAAHFYISDEKAKELMRELATQISGFLLPKLTREIGGEKNKRLINY